MTYTRLPNGTLYTGPLDQSNMVGGTNEDIRNSQHNPERLKRIKQLNSNPKVLDYGCGNGLLVKYLRGNNIWVDGYDPFNNIYSSPLPDSAYDIVTLIEVIEHTAEPYAEVDDIFRILRPGGILMIETSFSDFLEEDDPYLNPAIGHSTVFSYKGLDELMLSRGFEFGVKINRNVLLYRKPVKITLVTMGAGNPIALKRTLESFKDVCDEVVFGNLLIFPSDRDMIESYWSEYKIKIVKLPFGFIYRNGFSAVLNELAKYAKNDLCLYMNVSEVIDENFGILNLIKSNYTTWCFNHRIDGHRWHRLWNRKNVSWSGIIHEETVLGNVIRDPNPIFMMADTEKDDPGSFYAKILNSLKECVYWAQYLKLVDHPELIANTHPHWVTYAKDSYDDIKRRFLAKGKQIEALETDNVNMFINEVYTNDEFRNERQESSTLVNLQGLRKDIL